MTQSIPIYLCNVKASVINTRNHKSKEIDLKDLNGCILKGFNLEDMKDRWSMKRLLKTINNHVKLKPNEQLQIDKIEFIKQLGFGVDE